MKMMFGTVVDVGDKLIKTLALESSRAAGNVLEIKDIAARFTTDVIGSCAFGLDCSSLEDPKSEFRNNAKKVFDDPKYPQIVVQFFLMFKNLARKMHVVLLRKDTTSFFMNVVKDTVEYREKHSVQRNDFMHLLIQLKNKGALDGESVNIGKLSLEEVAAQGN